MRETWERSFKEQIAAARTTRRPSRRSCAASPTTCATAASRRDCTRPSSGCGAGPNLVWLADRGLRVSGIDISPTALELCRRTLAHAGHEPESLVEGSVTDVPWEDASLDVAVESCVFQHLARADREAAFREVDRLVKPGGLFVGHMLERAPQRLRAHAGRAAAGRSRARCGSRTAARTTT